MKRALVAIVGVALLMFLTSRIVILVGKGSGDRSERPGGPPVAVEADSVRYGPIREVRGFTGTVFPLYRYVVAPKVPGRIIELTKRIGDSVGHGEIVARIDDAEYQQAVREAEANLKIARATLAEAESEFELARQELERAQSLQAKGIASPSELDASATRHTAQAARLRLAQAQVEQREAALESARIRLGYTVLRGSGPGFVGERFADEGTLLAPNSPVASIIGIDTVIVRTAIIERDYGRVRVGQPVDVEVDAFAGKRFRGTVFRIAPMLKETSRMAEMEVTVANDSLLLKPGMFANVRVTLSERDRAQLVPTQAIVQQDGATGVFVVERDSAVVRFVLIQTGIGMSEKTEVVSPKLEGLIVTLGQHLLKDGSPVILPKGNQPIR
ncbi:MAG: efflux RND transporter periplasmic adaptor subunit [Candidatus Latescibacterota bacterium]